MKLNVVLMKIYDDNYEVKIKDSETRFLIPKEEFQELDPSKEFSKIGSNLSLLIEDNNIIKIEFNIFCYDEQWQKSVKELEDILSEIKFK